MKLIKYLIIFIPIIAIKGEEKLFNNAFKKIENIVLYQDLDNPVGSIIKMRIDKSGNIWIIDSINRSIKKFNKKKNLIDSFGRRGKGPEEFEFPIGIFVDENYIYICDLSLRVVKIFNLNDKKLIKSFYIGSCRDIYSNSKNEIFIIGFYYIKEKEGFFIRKFDHKGKLVNSFLSPNEKFFKLKMRLADAIFDFDKEENIFAAFAISYEIYKFDSDGKLLKIIRNPYNKYQFPPDSLPEYIKYPSRLREWYIKWHYIDNILVLNNNILLISLVMHDVRKYSIDIFNTKGEIIAQNILTPHRLMAKDREDNLYFLLNFFSKSDEKKYNIGKYKLLLKQ